VVADQGQGIIPPALRRIHAVTGAQSLITSGGQLVQPRGVARENNSLLVVSGGDRVVRVHPVTGAQSLVASGGNLSALGGIAVDDCTGDLFTASATPALVRVHPSTGTQSVVSSGGHFVQPLGVSLVPGDCLSLPLIGSAQGGSLGILFDQVTVTIPTTQGQSLQSILIALALAIRNHHVLEGAGIAATVSGLALHVRGEAPDVFLINNDPGLTLGPLPPEVPALSAAGFAALVALLAAGAALALQQRRGSGARTQR
jgi:hypothetical protein